MNGPAWTVDTPLAGRKGICNCRFAEVDQSLPELLQLFILCNARCHREGCVSLATIKHIVNVPEGFLVNNDFSPLKLIF